MTEEVEVARIADVPVTVELRSRSMFWPTFWAAASGTAFALVAIYTISAAFGI